MTIARMQIIISSHGLLSPFQLCRQDKDTEFISSLSRILAVRHEMKAPKPQAFNPPIQPIISAGEIDAYTAMIDGRLVPGNKSSLFSTSAVVVGAGLAGLAAARELKKAGVNVTILEGSDRAGGRCHTLSSSKFDKGLFAEAGGMRVPESHKIAMKYINTFGLKTIPFSNMKDKSGLLFFDGKKKKIDEDLNNPKSVLSRVVEKWDES